MSYLLTDMRKLFIAITAVTICCLGNEYPAEAQTTCRHNSWNDTTTCSTPNGSYTGRYNSWNDTTTWSGPSGSTTCRYNSWNDTTTCN